MDPFSVTRLTDPADIEPYLGLTYPNFWPLLRGPSSPDTLFVFAASNPEPLGLAVAQYLPELGRANLHSVSVVEEHRREGIALRLLTEVEQALRAAGIPQVYGVYPSGKPSTPAVERLLARAGWATPEPRMYLYRMSYTEGLGLVKAPWLRDRALPEGYTLFPWSELTDDEAADLRRQAEEGAFELSLSPFHNADKVDPVLSQGLRHEGKVVAWMIVHRVQSDVVRFSSLWAQPEVRNRGLGLAVMIESLMRLRDQAEAGQDGTVAWGTGENNTMAKFVERRIAPHVPGLQTTCTFGSYKDLLPAEGAG